MRSSSGAIGRPLILFLVVLSNSALAIDCGQAPRVDDERLRVELDAQGQVLSRRIGSAEFGGSLERTRTDIFSKYPNADRTRLNERLLFIVCQSIFNDRTLTEEQKRRELLRLTREIISGEGPSPPGPKVLFGHWSVVDPRTDTPFSTVELAPNGHFRSAGFGRDYGGPNGLGANRYRFENGILKFLYMQPGRASVDEMLVGSVRSLSEKEFRFTVVGGYYGRGQNLQTVFLFRRL